MTHLEQTGHAHPNAAPQHGQPGRAHQAHDHESHDRSQLGQEKHQAGQVDPAEHHSPPRDSHAAPEESGITIYIDHQPYHVASAEFSGADLRNVPVPPIGSDKNIFRVVSGTGGDIKLRDEDRITVNMREANEGRHFFSSPVAPSKDEVARKAYFIYLEQGSQPGHDAENWAKAEALLGTCSQ